ncbi:MAG TPA: hypothetical protein VNK24_09270 [Elusimicrobiota bacterium]|nr:hypothetical protein [Elusimicrobiota bacterium]
MGVVYLWFGALKLVGSSPALGLIRDLSPRLAVAPLYCALIAWEMGLGALFLSGRWIKPAALGAILHLIGTFGVALLDPSIAFHPYFPFLTLQGEFLAKNFVLLAAAYALWSGCHFPIAAAPPGSDRTNGKTYE